jgi:hypothetical protein
MSYGLRYEYYSPLHEANDKVLLFDIASGTLKPNYKGDWYQVSKLNFAPRLAFSWQPEKMQKTVFRVGAGYYYGPGQGEDQIQPALNDRINRTITSGALLTYPVSAQSILSSYNINDPNLQFQPRAYDGGYKIPEKVLQYTASIQQALPSNTVLTVAYVGSQGRNLFLRGITNKITDVTMNPTTGAGSAVREFGNGFAEIDLKTSGGNDHYNGLQTSLNRRAVRMVAFAGEHGRLQRGAVFGQQLQLPVRVRQQYVRCAAELQFERAVRSSVRHGAEDGRERESAGEGGPGRMAGGRDCQCEDRPAD